MFSLESIRLVGRSLVPAYYDGEHIPARFDMLLAATLAGLAAASGGLGAVHALGFELESGHGMSHGRAVAVLLPHVMRYIQPAAPAKLLCVAGALGEDTRDLSNEEERKERQRKSGYSLSNSRFRASSPTMGSRQRTYRKWQRARRGSRGCLRTMRAARRLKTSAISTCWASLTNREGSGCKSTGPPP